MGPHVEIIDFTRPDGSRQNLFVTNIPCTLSEEDIVYLLHEKFDRYGLVHGVQVFPCQWKQKSEPITENTDTKPGYYAFVTFYSATDSTSAKDDLNGVLILGDEECKVAFARRKKDVLEKHPLYFTKCYELINYYLGFNSWSTNIKTLFEDTDVPVQTDQTRYVKYVCLIELTVQDLKTDGVGVWQEAVVNKDPLSKIQATAKCKKLCHMRAIENAFSKVLLIVLSNGKVTVEIDTTRPEFRSDVVPEDQLVKVNELDDQPEAESAGHNTEIKGGNLSTTDMDNLNLHILQELEDDM